MTSMQRALRAGAIAYIALAAACGGKGGSGAAPVSYPANYEPMSLDRSYSGSIAGGSIKRYGATVTAGTQYVVSLTGIVGAADLVVYTDNTLTAHATCAAPNTGASGAAPEDCTVTATASTLYLTVSNPGSANDSFRVRVAQQSAASGIQGSAGTPVVLTQGSSWAGSVGGPAPASSYYAVTLTGTGSFSINLTGLQSPEDVAMAVFTDPGFTTPESGCAYTGLGGVAPEECVVAAGTYYIQVTNNSGAGGAYLLTAD